MRNKIYKKYKSIPGLTGIGLKLYQCLLNKQNKEQKTVRNELIKVS